MIELQNLKMDDIFYFVDVKYISIYKVTKEMRYDKEYIKQFYLIKQKPKYYIGVELIKVIPNLDKYIEKSLIKIIKQEDENNLFTNIDEAKEYQCELFLAEDDEYEVYNNRKKNCDMARCHDGCEHYYDCWV